VALELAREILGGGDVRGGARGIETHEALGHLVEIRLQTGTP
jgi:hypothetical protein